MDEELRSEIEGMIGSIANERARSHVAKALKYVGNASRRLIVANGVAKAREAGHDDLALKLARLAHEESPEDPFLLLEVCGSTGQPEEVVKEIEKYRERVGLDSLPLDEREKVTVALAEAYRDAGRKSDSVQLLEELNSELGRAVELLAGQYLEMGEPQKAVDLLYERLKYVGKLTPEMVSCMASGFDALGDYKQAFDKLAQFQEDAAVQPIFDKARAELGFPVEPGGQKIPRLSFEHPQPDDYERKKAEDDLSSLI